MRIAIIGAGPGGLAAAERLKEKGYEDTVIFEKRDRVGGMSLSKVYKAENGKEIVYDLGSIQPVGGSEFRNLVKKYKLKWGRGISIKHSKLFKFYDHETRAYTVDFKNYFFGYKLAKLPSVFIDSLKIFFQLFRFRRFYKPSYNDCPHIEEASMPMEEWIKSLNLKVIEKEFIYSLCSAEAGSNRSRAIAEAALYGIKLIAKMVRYPIRYIDGTYKPIRTGYQSVWQEVAKQHDVRLSSKITKIERIGKDKIIIHHHEGSKEEFDRLIVACPISQLDGIMEMTDDEKYISSNVIFNPVWRCAFLAKGLPKEQVTLMLECYFSSKKGRSPIGMLIPEGDIDEETTLYSATLQPLDQNVDDEYLEFINKNLNHHFGGTITKWLDRQFWPNYNSMFNRESIKNNIFDKFNNIQGLNNTYYVGELLTGAGHAEVTRFSYHLINKFWR